GGVSLIGKIHGWIAVAAIERGIVIFAIGVVITKDLIVHGQGTVGLEPLAKGFGGRVHGMSLTRAGGTIEHDIEQQREFRVNVSLDNVLGTVNTFDFDSGHTDVGQNRVDAI